jgi:two-component system nitrogen regulation sensor histidine kinase NtrY
MGDDAQLQLAITNILRNSVEAIDETDPPERAIEVELSAKANEVELTIGDSGPGWSGAEQSEVPLTSTKKDGTGIGLYVVRTAVQNHGGKIEFGRSPLGGAEVRLTFPRAEKI